MATTYGTTSAGSSANYDMSLWYDSKYYKIGMLTMLSVSYTHLTLPTSDLV